MFIPTIMVAVLFGQAPVTKAETPVQGLTRGTGRRLRSLSGSCAPAFTDLDSYRTYIEAVRNQNKAEIMALRPDCLHLIPDGWKVRVDETEDQIKVPDNKVQKFPINVRPVYVRVVSQRSAHSPWTLKTPVWVPSLY